MYESFFNLHTLPFECTPDPRFFFATEQHKEALAAIEYTIRMRKGIVMVTGTIGAGKTTVGRTMLQRCANQATIIPVVHGHSRGPELIKHILRTLKVQVRKGEDHAELLEHLERQLLEHARIGKPVVLFIDEAQTLSDDALEELRLLSNFDTDQQRLLQLVMVGQPELRDRIRSDAMAPLRQRIVMAKQLLPLSIQETAAYILHRLRTASKNPQQIAVSFTGEAIEMIHAASQGTPRRINVLCDNGLLLAFVSESRRVTPAMIRRVVEDMVPDFDTQIDSAPQERKLALAGGM